MSQRTGSEARGAGRRGLWSRLISSLGRWFTGARDQSATDARAATGVRLRRAMDADLGEPASGGVRYGLVLDEGPGPAAKADQAPLEEGPRRAGGGVAGVLSRFKGFDVKPPAAGELFRLCLEREAAGLGVEAQTSERLGRQPGASGPVPSLEALWREDLKLAAVPEIQARLQAFLASGTGRVEEAATIIGLDPGLSAALLKMVNSAFYGRAMRASSGRFPSQVSSLSRAVTVVGETALVNLSAAVSVLPLFQHLPGGVLDVRSLWRHSLAVAILARGLARRLPELDAEQVFLAGLLHDIGRLAALRRVPGHMARAMVLAGEEGIPLVVAEGRVLGWDHGVLGGFLLEKWRYPAELRRMVAGHHDPEVVESDNGAATVHLADAVVGALGLGASGERRIPPVFPGVWDRLVGDGATLRAAVAEVDAELDAAASHLAPVKA